MTASEPNDRIRIDLDRLSVEVADLVRAVDRLIVLEEERSRRFDQMVMRQELVDQRVEITRVATTLRNASWLVGLGVPAAIGLTAPLVEVL